MARLPDARRAKLSGGDGETKLGTAACSGQTKLLLDEPGVGVDLSHPARTVADGAELAGEGMLILWSASYLDEAEQCRDVLLMNEGELLYQGEPTAESSSHGRTAHRC